MHYIGMLAFGLPVPVQYDWPTASLSFFAGIFSSVVALVVVSRQKVGPLSTLAGSIFMGQWDRCHALHRNVFDAPHSHVPGGREPPFRTLADILLFQATFRNS